MMAAPSVARAYVANQISDNLTVFDTATNTVVTTVPIGNFPVGVASRLRVTSLQFGARILTSQGQIQCR